MVLHETNLAFLTPTAEQRASMDRMRAAAAAYADVLMAELPTGPDKIYTLQKLREVAMWANVSATLAPDGSPRYVPLPEPTSGP